jgi:hypothetical protein
MHDVAISGTRRKPEIGGRGNTGSAPLSETPSRPVSTTPPGRDPRHCQGETVNVSVSGHGIIGPRRSTCRPVPTASPGRDSQHAGQGPRHLRRAQDNGGPSE